MARGTSDRVHRPSALSWLIWRVWGAHLVGEIADVGTVLGILIALGVLAASIGLIRSETARDLRMLTATGASTTTRRTITAATAAALGLLGAVLGMAIAVVPGWFGRMPACPPYSATCR